MARIWKKHYSRTAALEAGIHDFEGMAVVGAPTSRWIYYVRECGFTFAFFSTEMIEEYLAYYSRKILPTSRFAAAASVGDGQSKFERLPGKLRAKARRQKIVKALMKALVQFREEKRPNKAPEPTPRLGVIRSHFRRAKLSGNLRVVAHL